MLFEELHPGELKGIIEKSGTVFLPLGTLEWHENHLPFGVDALISYKICRAVCNKVGGCVIPPLYFGTDREHNINGRIMHGMDAKVGKILPGSIYFLKPDLFYQLLKSIAENVAEQGFKRLVVVSAHSGTAQQQALEKLSKEKVGNLKILVFPGREFPGGIDHAAKIETNLVLALRKDLVHISKLKKPYTGLIGDDPLESNEQDGKKQFNEIVEFIVNKVKEDE
ncbi:creatininase family protein [Candidatus Woesearchaeota archaeon]|nr:creatininase family protein [Candidatus Woesearchaeota archaeon]